MAPQVINKTDIEIFQWNSRSIVNKESELKKEIRRQKYEIFAIQETWLKEKDNFKFKPYVVLRSDRINRQGGGVMFLVKDTIQFHKKNLILYQNRPCKVQAIQVKLQGSLTS